MDVTKTSKENFKILSFILSPSVVSSTEVERVIKRKGDAMTSLTIAYQNYEEAKRHNQAVEQETHSYNVATINELVRSHQAQEVELNRHNLAMENLQSETVQIDWAKYFLSQQQFDFDKLIRSGQLELQTQSLVETMRHNQQQELLTAQQNAIAWANYSVNQQNAQTRSEELVQRNLEYTLDADKFSFDKEKYIDQYNLQVSENAAKISQMLQSVQTAASQIPLNEANAGLSSIRTEVEHINEYVEWANVINRYLNTGATWYKVLKGDNNYGQETKTETGFGDDITRNLWYLLFQAD